MANLHRKNNHMGRLKVNGSYLNAEEEIKAAPVEFYQSMYTERMSQRPEVMSLVFRRLNVGISEWLERPFEEEEVWRIMKDMNEEKAPGPDGFSMAFFHSCWEIVKGDVLVVLDEFHREGRLELILNATFVSLLPKKVGAHELRDFRPRSIISSMYKILAK